MAKSGLQQDVINLYRQGIRSVLSKPADARPAFLLHWRYNFRNPQLKKRDYSAIEHQLRRLSRTLEMLSSPSVSRISTSTEMTHWWDTEVARCRSAAAAATAGKTVKPSASESAPTGFSASSSSAQPSQSDAHAGMSASASASAGGPRIGVASASGSGMRSGSESHRPAPGSSPSRSQIRMLSTFPHSITQSGTRLPSTLSSVFGQSSRSQRYSTPSSYDGADPTGQTATEITQDENKSKQTDANANANAGKGTTNDGGAATKEETGSTGKGKGKEGDEAQWGGTLPGHGGT